MKTIGQPYQNANYGVMIRVLGVIGGAFYDLQKEQYKSVVNGHLKQRRQ